MSAHRASRVGARPLAALAVVGACVVGAGVAIGTAGTDAPSIAAAAAASPTPDAGSPRSTARPRPDTAAAESSDAGARAGVGSVPGPDSTPSVVRRGLRPVRISVPAIGVDASMTDLGIARDGSIEVPSDTAQAGWLDTTPTPGQQGPAVVAGHVDSTTGPAVFYELDTLVGGDTIVITLRNGSRRSFTVDGVRTYEQDRFPTAEVYGPVPGSALRLITCGGDYDASEGGYQSNVVVYAS